MRTDGDGRQDENALLEEAIELNIGLEALAEEGANALKGAGPVKRVAAEGMVRRATGLSLDGLWEEARSASALLRRLRDGTADPSGARGRLRGYAALVRRVARFFEGLEPQARRMMKDAGSREEILGIARTHIAEGERLASILERLAEG